MDIKQYHLKTITSAVCQDDLLKLNFSDDTYILLSDSAQYCCEQRYMTCDDNPADLVGGQLLSIESVPVPNGTDTDSGSDYDCHDADAIKIETTKGFITIVTHNIHNGYYGGFDICLEFSHS